MSKKNYYEILGVDKNASKDEIRKAKKKLTIQWHPDKWQNKSEEEQKIATEKMADINEAYDVLTDDEKRYKYDNGIDGNRVSSESRFVVKGSDKNVSLTINIKDACCGMHREFEYKRYVPCKHCGGGGSEDGKPCVCPVCGGSGFNEVYIAFFGQSIKQPCRECGGTGRGVPTNPCHVCHGRGEAEKQTKFAFDIPAGVPNGAMFRVENMGHVPASKNGVPGDLNIRVVVKDDENYHLDENGNVIREFTIPFTDFLLGTTRKIELPDGTVEDVALPECSNFQTDVVYNGKGLFVRNVPRRGNVIIRFKAKVPKTLNNEQKRLIRKIKETL